MVKAIQMLEGARHQKVKSSLVGGGLYARRSYEQTLNQGPLALFCCALDDRMAIEELAKDGRRGQPHCERGLPTSSASQSGASHAAMQQVTFVSTT